MSILEVFGSIIIWFLILYASYVWIIKPKFIIPFMEGYKGILNGNRTKDNHLNSKEKGDLFEKYIVQKFDKSFFTLLEWRSDKYINGQYAISNKLPDLEVKFEVNDFYSVFAVECKYRSFDNNGFIELSKDYQFKNYKNYEKEKGIPVYFALGLNGKPTEPNELFIIPLQRLKSNLVKYDELLPFKKRVDSFFYFDRYDKNLK